MSLCCNVAFVSVYVLYVFYMLLSAAPTLLCISVCSLEMVKGGKVNVGLDNAGIEEGYLFFY